MAASRAAHFPDLAAGVRERTALRVRAALADRPARLALARHLRPCDPDLAATHLLALLTGPLDYRPDAAPGAVADGAVEVFLRAYAACGPAPREPQERRRPAAGAAVPRRPQLVQHRAGQQQVRDGGGQAARAVFSFLQGAMARDAAVALKPGLSPPHWVTKHRARCGTAHFPATAGRGTGAPGLAELRQAVWTAGGYGRLAERYRL
ncbi:TetR/AcrR family transcriptional regulator C-terminal domain-containing protein [Kitasatospora sp. NPDC053057]|uniref:TetR/AcrR family transcriptional regulator C-terminal domain-containing protein n=1 Tax=Kitasatospora sp. NPDC053057 TaxID=3364062 RepID=UPI0037C7508F